MGPRTRRAAAAIMTLVFLASYVVGVVTVVDMLPDVAWMKLVFLAVAGVAWGLPLLPIFSWAERGGRRRND